jgi:putative PIN family toxin of toxin-antitoxin system
VSRLVVDTNVLLSSFLTSGPPRQVMNRIRDSLDLLFLSQPILEEYLAVLRRAGVARTLVESLLVLLQDPERVAVVIPTRRVDIIREDPSDNIFLECAIEARADYIITGDRHLKRVGHFGGIEILSPREYLATME